MTIDDTFRWILIIFCGAFLPIGLYYRIRSNTGEKLDRWQEGAFILFGLRLNAFVVFVGGVAWLIDPRSMSWSALPIPVWLRWIGLAILLLGALVLLWAFRSLGRNLTDTVVIRKEHSLVTTGPYRWVRHPFYAACAMEIAGGSLVTANGFILLFASIVFAFLVARTRIEEAKLIERFGDEYRDWMRRVGRFFPRLRR